MKVLFHHHTPFAFAHGGLQIQITRTREALLRAGVEVEFFRWYDGDQTGDVLHFFGRMPTFLLQLARRKRMQIVSTVALGGPAARSPGELWLLRMAIRSLKKILPPSRAAMFDWDIYEQADACIASTPWEAHLMSYLFEAAPQKVHVVPNGVEEAFLKSAPASRENWLVCAAAIVPRERVVELAEAAIVAKVPLRIIGKPGSESDSYFQRFLALAREHPQVIRYNGPLSDPEELARSYREARAFVLLSRCESLSLSALEAAASECPLLLSDCRSTRGAFKEHASYCPITSLSRTAQFLRQFYEHAPELPRPPKPATWMEIAEKLKGLYEAVLKNSR